ncbi:MAG TPA: cupin domain-containing protein [Chloroflexota bacterium]|nr:cupin domain-containing protein [Chloroflexota bacterium]
MGDQKPYFQTASQDEPEQAATWFDVHADVPSIELAPNLHTRAVIGAGMALSFVTFAPHAEAVIHSHAEEQFVLVLEGEVEFEVGGETRMLRPGMGILIPPFVSHGARTYDTPCTEVDVFHPPRQALIEKLQTLSSR